MVTFHNIKITISPIISEFFCIGPPGISGERGYPGELGADGLPGLSGITGAPGLDGKRKNNLKYHIQNTFCNECIYS